MTKKEFEKFLVKNGVKKHLAKHLVQEELTKKELAPLKPDSTDFEIDVHINIETKDKPHL